MLQLKNNNLTLATQQHLNKRQADINGRPAFIDKSGRAGTLWDGKTGSQAGKAAFEEIKNTLIAMCVGVELCNYCEQSEASDIEHILPKSLFPAHAFEWENYLLACKKCNTTHKLDAIDVFDPDGSTNAIRVASGSEPPTHDVAFVHPRRVDPMDFMDLNFDDFLFYARPPHAPNTRGFVMVEKTLDILELNNRPTLVNYRRSAFHNYKRMLREFVETNQATTYDELEQAVTGNPQVDRQSPFEAEKQRILDGLRTSILTHEHPTVWREMIRQRNNLPQPIQQLFHDAPEALIWHQIN